MKIISIFFIVILALALIPLPHQSASAEKTTEMTFSGRLIYIADDYIEIKKDRIETVVYLSDNTRYISISGTEAKRDIMRICQYVNVYYTIEGTKKILDKLLITKESSCFK